MIALFFVGHVLASTMEMPKHAHPVPHLWKWECDAGYVQQRDKCVTVPHPKHSVPTPDGHGWECKDGYHKYRGGCIKQKTKR